MDADESSALENSCVLAFMIFSFVCEIRATHLDKRMNDSLTKPE